MTLPEIPVSYSILLGAAGVILTLLGVSYKIGQLTNSLEGLDDVSKLSTQVETLVSSFDVSRLTQIPSDIDDVRDSIGNIEEAVTSVDFREMQNKIEQILRGIGDGGELPTPNSVRYDLPESGSAVTISISGKSESAAQVNFRFDEDLKVRLLADLITEDEELSQLEMDLFGAEPSLRVPSPRQVNFVIPSGDIDAIAEWVPEMVERLDQYIVETADMEEEFDERVGEALGVE